MPFVRLLLKKKENQPSVRLYLSSIPPHLYLLQSSSGAVYSEEAIWKAYEKKERELNGGGSSSGSSDEGGKPARRRRGARSTRRTKGADEEDDGEELASSAASSSEEEEDDQPLPRLLARKELTATEWREVCQDMNTSEITRGSLWLQTEEDWASESPELIEKYLVRWSTMSYLHVSWETASDLIQCVGPQAKVGR